MGEIIDLDAHRLSRLAPRVIDIPLLRRSLTPAMRRVARRIEHLVNVEGLQLDAAAWRAWDLHPRLQAWQIMAARDLAGWRLQRRA